MSSPPDPSRPTAADAVYAKVGRRLIPLLIVCYFSAYIDRSNIGIAKLAFTRDLGIDEAAYGLAGGLFYLGYSLFEIPSNLMLRRIGARRTFFRILVLWSALTLLAAFMSRALHLHWLRFLIGAAEAGFFPGVLLYLAQWAPASRRARFTAWFMSAMAMSGVVGGPLAGLVLSTLDGVGGLHGWQWLFIVEGVPGILLGLVVIAVLPDGPADASWLTPPERDLIRAELAAEARAPLAGARGTLADVLRDRRFYGLAAMSMALIGGIGGIALWMPTLLKAAGIRSNAQSATLTAIPYLFALVAQQWQARRSDRSGERIGHASVPALLAGVAWLCIPLSPHAPWLTLALLTVACAATFAATGPFWALPPTLLRGPAAAVGIAAVTTCGSIAAFLGPVFVGWAATALHDTRIGPLYYGVLTLAGALTLRWSASQGSASAGHRAQEIQ